MTWARAALAIGVAVAVAAVLVSGGRVTGPEAPEFLRIAGAGEGGRTVVLDSFGKVVALRQPDARARADLRWVKEARPLGERAPRWARRMQARSLLVLRALTYPNGAAIAGARDGWAYVWPRDAGAVAVAFAAAGYRAEARRVASFLRGLDLDAAARFYPDGSPVPGRDAQGDARGWVKAASLAARVSASAGGVSEVNYPYGGLTSLTPPRQPLSSPHQDRQWRDRADYQEKDADDYIANAIAAAGAAAVGRPGAPAAPAEPALLPEFGGPGGVLVRRAGNPESGVDSAVAWAVRPFPHPALFPAARRSLHRLLDERRGRFGIVPSEDWPEDDPWTAPTAWTAWAFAAPAASGGRAPPPGPTAAEDRRTALGLMNNLRRAATPLGLLPERVDAVTGAPRSTTPLAWSHAFAILALRELWP